MQKLPRVRCGITTAYNHKLQPQPTRMIFAVCNVTVVCVGEQHSHGRPAAVCAQSLHAAAQLSGVRARRADEVYSFLAVQQKDDHFKGTILIRRCFCCFSASLTIIVLK